MEVSDLWTETSNVVLFSSFIYFLFPYYLSVRIQDENFGTFDFFLSKLKRFEQLWGK